MTDIPPPPPPPPAHRYPQLPPSSREVTATTSSETTTVVERTGPPPPLMFCLGLLFGAIIGFAIGLVLWHTGSSSAGLWSGGLAALELGW